MQYSFHTRQQGQAALPARQPITLAASSLGRAVHAAREEHRAVQPAVGPAAAPWRHLSHRSPACRLRRRRCDFRSDGFLCVLPFPCTATWPSEQSLSRAVFGRCVFGRLSACPSACLPLPCPSSALYWYVMCLLLLLSLLRVQNTEDEILKAAVMK